MSGALIAMSGGVDSSVAALLAARQGLDCFGCMMKLFTNDDIGESRENTCCSLKDAADAADAANKLGIPFHVFNFTEAFKESVITRFIEAYQKGDTPNPCIDCNRCLKFEKLLSKAKELDKDYIVTGHYARIEYNPETGRHILKKGADLSKDQSYVLYSMTQEQLKRTIFPLGALHKSEVRSIAERHGLLNAKKRDSQDICFVPDGDYARFIERSTGKLCEPGDFLDTDGNVLGRHKGLIRYTIGQRKGLGLSFLNPMYVQSKNAGDNSVVLCENSGLFSKTLYASSFNWISDKPEAPIRAKAKLRYKHAEQWATAARISPDMVRIDFDEPQRAVTSGQAVVLYDGDTVIGGGTIDAGTARK